MLLPDLPAELPAEVKTNLSYGSCVALRPTCRTLYRKVDDPNQHTNGACSDASTRVGSTVRNYNMRDLLEIEMWPEYNSAYHRPAELKQPIRGLDFFACYVCRKIRCASKFSIASLRNSLHRAVPSYLRYNVFSYAMNTLRRSELGETCQAQSQYCR